MAIPDQGKLFETTNAQQNKWLGVAVKCNKDSLVVLMMNGKRSSSLLDVVSVSDEKGNSYEFETRPSASGFVCVAWARLKNALAIGDLIRIDFNAKPSAMWITGHVFEGASDTPTDITTISVTSTNPQMTVDVVGSDYLVVGVVSFPTQSGVSIAPVNSSVSQDSTTGPPYGEAFSFNGTTGSTFTIGGTISQSATWAGIAVSFPSDAMPTPSKNQLLGMAV